MKIWQAAVTVTAIGAVVGYGSAWFEFHDVVEQFEPHNASVSGSMKLMNSDPLPVATVVGGDTYNFGSGQRHSKMEHTFTIRNDGNAPLNLTLGGTTCKCTLGALDKDEVPPGESTTVKLSWRIETHATSFRQTASINTDDPDRRTIILTIEGTVSDIVRLDPDTLALSSISAGEQTTAEFHLYSYGQEELEVLHYEWSNSETADYFDLALEKVEPKQFEEGQDQPTHDIRGILTIKPGLPLGPINQTIRLTTNLDRESVIELLIVGTVTSDISLVGKGYSPTSGILVLGHVNRVEGAVANLKLLVRGPYKDEVRFHVREIDPADSLRVRIGARSGIGDGTVHVYPLFIDVPPDAHPVSRLSAKPAEMGRVVTDTNHPVAKELIIYVRFAVE